MIQSLTDAQPDTPLIITAAMVRWFTVCQRRVWLDAKEKRVEPDPLTTIQAYQLVQDIRHEQMVQQAIAPQIRQIHVRSWAHGVALTEALMREGAPRIHEAYLERLVQLDTVDRPVLLRGRAEWLERHEHPRRHGSSVGQWLYSPREIKAYNGVTEADRLQLDQYTWTLMLLQDSEDLFPEFWLKGKDGSLIETQAHEFDEQRLRNALTQVASLLPGAGDAPEVVITSVCRQCHWQTACRQIAHTRLDVNILPRLSSNTRKHFKQEGITSLSQVVAMTPDELRRFKGIKSKAEGIHAHAQAFLNKTPVWYRPVPDHLRSGGWMFDIETVMPENSLVWSIGWSDGGGEVKIVIVDPDARPNDGIRYTLLHLPNGQAVHVARDADEAWRVFADAVDDSRPIFHWSPFDQGVMRNNAPHDVRTRLGGRLFDLCHIFDQVVKCPIPSLSLKTVAPYVAPSFGWDEQGNAFLAFDNYRAWLRSRTLDALGHACQYQGDDVRAMLLVGEWLMRNQP